MASSIDDKKDTARLIRKLRAEQKWSQQQLAERAGVSFSFVNQVEGGKQTVRLDTLNKLLSVFAYRMAAQPLPQKKLVPFAPTASDPEPPEIQPQLRQKNDWAFFK